MTILYIVYMDFVIKCVGGYCQQFSPTEFNLLLKSGILTLVFDASMVLKIFMQITRDKDEETK